MVITTRESFLRALASSLAGANIVYHEGLLMRDRSIGPNFLAVHSLARAVWEAMELGKVDLFQRRQGAGYVYIAHVKRPPHKVVAWTGCYDPRRYSYKDREKMAA